MRFVLRLKCSKGAAPGGAGQSLAVLVVRVVIVGAVCASLAAFQEGPAQPAQEEAVP